MKTYSIEHVTIWKIFAYLLLSITLTLMLTVATAKFIGPGIYPVCTLIGLPVILFFVGKKVIKQKVLIGISDTEIVVGQDKMALHDLQSYYFDKSQYLELITLRFRNRTLKINNPLKSSTRNDFVKFKKKVISSINKENQARTEFDKIGERSFFNSRYAKPYAYFMIALMIAWGIGMIVKSENFKVSNFALFLVVLSGLIPMLIKIFGSKPASSNSSKQSP